MAGLVYKNTNSQLVSISGTAYTNPSAGTARLNFKTGSASTDVLKFGLTTNTSASQYCGLRMKVSGGTAYIGRSESARSTVKTSSSTTQQTNTSSSSSTSSSTTYTSQSTRSYTTQSISTYATSSAHTYSTFSTSSYATSSTRSYTTSSSQATNSTNTYQTSSSRSYTTFSTNQYTTASAYGKNSTNSYGTHSVKTYQTTSNNSTVNRAWSTSHTWQTMVPYNMVSSSRQLTFTAGEYNTVSTQGYIPTTGTISGPNAGAPSAPYGTLSHGGIYYTGTRILGYYTETYPNSYTVPGSATYTVQKQSNYTYVSNYNSQVQGTFTTSGNRKIYAAPSTVSMYSSRSTSIMYWTASGASCPGQIGKTSGATRTGTVAVNGVTLTSTSSGFLITKTKAHKVSGNKTTWRWTGSYAKNYYTFTSTSNQVATRPGTSVSYWTETLTNYWTDTINQTLTRTTATQFARDYVRSSYNWYFTTSLTTSRYTTLNSTVNYNTTSTSYWTVTSTHTHTSTVNYNTTSTSYWNSTSTSYWTNTGQYNTTSTSNYNTTSTSTWNTSSRSNYNTSSNHQYNTTSISTWNTSSSMSTSTSGTLTTSQGSTNNNYTYTKSYLTHNFNI